MQRREFLKLSALATASAVAATRAGAATPVKSPRHYKLAKTKLQRDPLAKFLTEMGLTKVEPQDTFKVTKSSLPEETAVVVLEAKGA